MTDTMSRGERSARMALIGPKHTAPEQQVRAIVRGLGQPYRLHAKTLPGRPDLVFPRLKRAIFVHGCFWHRHGAATCTRARMPKSRLGFWRPKLESNRLRDGRNQRALHRLGWRVLVVWECRLARPDAVRRRIADFLRGRRG